MNPLFQCKPRILPLFIAGVFACFGLLPKARAVVPPPDGGYPNFTTAEGTSALQSLTTGVGNTAAGWRSLFANTVGNLNTAIGAGTLLLNTGDNNTATGALALFSNTTGIENTANGALALLSNTGLGNTAIGAFTLQNNTTGSVNTAVGDAALFSNTIGGANVALGELALSNNTAGSANTAVGALALSSNTTGTGNIALGAAAGGNVSSANNVICIATNGENVSDSCYIGNIYNAVIDPATTLAVGIDGTLRLGAHVSAERFKRDIQPMGAASEAILALKPVMFHYKSDSKNTPCFGLVAEHVAEVNPHLVVSDKEGKPYAVRYDQVNAMLLNEFLKEHRKVEKLEATIAKQRTDFEAALADLKGQIQKVSAQLQLNKTAPQTVLNNQ